MREPHMGGSRVQALFAARLAQRRGEAPGAADGELSAFGESIGIGPLGSGPAMPAPEQPATVGTMGGTASPPARVPNGQPRGLFRHDRLRGRVVRDGGMG